MGIDIRFLSPEAQAQIVRKLGEQARQQAEREKANKYHAVMDDRIAEDGKKIRFRSKAEARRYDTLMLLLKAGAITELKLQPQFTLQEAYTTPEGKRVRAIRYDADFSYKREDGELIVEDVKGGNATKTRVYAIKKKLLLEKHGITIHEIEQG